MMSILKEAQEQVADREKKYGDPKVNIQRIADLWTAYLGIKIIPIQVCLCQELVKIARAANDPYYRDDHVDVAGYAEVAGRFLEPASLTPKGMEECGCFTCTKDLAKGIPGVD